MTKRQETIADLYLGLTTEELVANMKLLAKAGLTVSDIRLAMERWQTLTGGRALKAT